MKDGLKKIIEPAVAGGLLNFHRANLGHAGGELLLQGEHRNTEEKVSLSRNGNLIAKGLLHDARKLILKERIP